MNMTNKLEMRRIMFGPMTTFYICGNTCFYAGLWEIYLLIIQSDEKRKVSYFLA